MTESVEYQVVREIGNVEIRKYPSIILATVKSDYDDMAFSLLFRYISGQNEAGERIAMTAPVVSTGAGVKIPMTTPVISDEASFSFVLPLKYELVNAPRPLDPRIELVSVPQRYVATLRFSGRAYQRDIIIRVKELLTELDKQSIRYRGSSFLMRYNSPFSPGFMRRNEVGVEIASEDLPRGE